MNSQVHPEKQILHNYVAGLANWITFTELFYMGVIAGSEFLTYAATKAYICYELWAGYGGNPITSNAFVQTYDIANAQNGIYHDAVYYWNAVGAAFNEAGNVMILKDFYFSRIAAGSYTYMKFIGWRISTV